MSDQNNDFNKKYKYDEMANKVLRSDRKHTHKDANSNPESLAGKISVRDMGTSVVQTNSAVVEAMKSHQGVSRKVARDSGGFTNSSTLLTSTIESLNYYPRSQETALKFEEIMAWCMKYFSDSSHEIIISAADALLEILKNEDISDKQKLEECKDIMNDITPDDFSDLINLSKGITDYGLQEPRLQGEGDGEGVAVVLDDSDEERGAADNDEEEDIEELVSNATLDSDQQDEIANFESERVLNLDTEDNTNDGTLLALNELDQFWLQREISKLFPQDAHNTQRLSNRIYEILSSDLDLRSIESELRGILESENFDFAAKLLKNRYRIVYSYKINEVSDENSKQEIIKEMRQNNLDSLIDEFLNQSITSNGEEVTTRKKRRLSEDSFVQVNNKREPKIVDLNSLVFDQGSHLMTTTKVSLPQGSTQEKKKSYDIIRIPPPKSNKSEDPLVKISELPSWMQPVFPSDETTSLNRIQSKVYPIALEKDSNLLLCAPTGAGKTNVAMLTILRTIDNYRASDGQISFNDFKIVYIAPLKALVQEQVREFSRRLNQFGIQVNELTGDSTLTKQQISETQILVTTPEKWDVITRKNSDTSYTNLVRLIIIDEIHLLHDERGPVLESIVSRTIRQMEMNGENTRLVGLSATLPNYEDVAKFLRVDEGLFYFDSSYRPCPLGQQFIGIKEQKAIKKLQAMNEACYDKILEAAGKYQVIVFVHSRKETYKTAKWIRDKLLEEDRLHLFLKSDAGSVEILKQESEKMRNSNLQDLLPSGFGIHHAGLNKDERSTVEDLFAEGHLQVLVSTATLAWGVNLPAHSVIIKGTDIYSPEKGSWVQLSPQDILQMLGRAGRPRYDKSGEGIIITSQDEIQYYLAILNQQLPIESQLMSKLADNLNAEVVLGSVKSREDAINWLGYTYLFVRMLQSPALYHVGAEYADDKVLFWKRADLCHSALTILRKNNLVQYDEKSGEVKSTELGKISSHYYISYDTMNMYNSQLKPWLSEIEILKIFASSGEFKLLPTRQEEKLEIKKLLEKCPIPIKESANDPLAKVNVLLQAYISKLKLEGFALMSDMIYITQSAGRLLRAIYEICLKKNWASLTKMTLNLSKMVEKRMWLSNSPFRQFPGCPTEIIRKTESSQIPWSSYFDLSDASEVSQAIRSDKFGKTAFDLLNQFPKVSVNYNVQPVTPTLLRVELEIMPQWTWNKSIHGNCEPFLILIEDCNGEKILFSDTLLVYHNYISQEHIVELTVPITEPIQPNYFITVISERWLHCEYKTPLVLTNLKVPKKFPPYTALLDLQSIPTSDLKHDEFIEVFDFQHFNKFQTQTFESLFLSDDNVFIGSSKGSGKTTCAILAILRHWNENRGRAVYISPNQDQIDYTLKVWKKKLSNIAGGKVVSKLTGDMSQDLKVLASSHLILSTPQQFDSISRRWRQRKNVQSIDLFVADDCHMVGNGISGAVYEIVIARMRFISAQVENGLRIIGLSTSVSNGKDFGEWMGCDKQNIFNFDPSKRFNKIKEIRLQAFNINHNPSLVLAMIRPTFQFITTHGLNRTSIVFVPSRKQCVEIGFEMAQLASHGGHKLLKTAVEDIEPYMRKMADKTLSESLSNGIGYYYPNMANNDKIIVDSLFKENILSILLVTRDTCYTCPSASLVAILSTQYYDGKEHRYIDYSINEVLEMVGCARDDDTGSKILILTNAAKLNYYNKFLSEALPVESFLSFYLHDAFVNEISTGIIKSQQDCVDWLTYTYFYRRLQLNPSFYGVKNVSYLGLSEFMSELVETTLKDLVEIKMIEVEEGDSEDDSEEISPLNGAMIAAYYNVSFITMQTLTLSLTNRTKLKGILEIITSASEFEALPIRSHEASILQKIYHRLPIKIARADFESPHLKAFILLQAHFSRLTLPADLISDQKLVLEKVLNLLYAAIDILSGEGYLNAINVMDLSQMTIQAVWDSDKPLKQVPFFDAAILARCEKSGVETVFDIMSLEDDERDDIISLDEKKLSKVADFVNKYPNVDISFDLDLSQPIVTNEPKEITINLERDEDVEDLEVVAPFYPFKKTENWWIVIGDSRSKQLYAIKRTTIAKESQQLKLQFSVPTAGAQKLSIWCMCDSYIDADKEISLEIDVQQGDEEMDD